MLSALIVIVLLSLGWFYFYNTKDSNGPGATITNKISYSVEKGTEAMARVAIPAVEEYANQDIAEPFMSRKERLGKYFSPNSSVYERELDIRAENSIIKTQAKVTSISFSKTAEGNYPCLIVKTELTSYFGDKHSAAKQNYWVTIEKGDNGEYLVNDIGLYW
jgi:hypothetical protein